MAGVPLPNYQITMAHGPNGYRCGCQWVCAYGQWGCITQLLWVWVHTWNGQWGPMAIGWCQTGVLLWWFGAAHCSLWCTNAKWEWLMVAIGYRCVCHWVCCYGACGQQTPIWARQSPTRNFLAAKLGNVAVGVGWSESGTGTPKGQPLMVTPSRGFLMCVCGGE